METLVGPDGLSGGDDPPEMAKTLVFEPGTLSIFQVNVIFFVDIIFSQGEYFISTNDKRNIKLKL